MKFFVWEIGYMRSIDIIVDRAGWEIQWGCLVWVPSVYTLHSRFLVLHPSGLEPWQAGLVAGVGFAGVLLNYWADKQRQDFREHYLEHCSAPEEYVPLTLARIFCDLQIQL